MKTIILAWLLGLGLLQLACQKPKEITDDRPAIKAISFVGVPNQNVRFDAPNGRITVHLPPVIEGGLKPIFELTEGAQLLDGVMADGTIDLSVFCYCNRSGQSPKVILRVGNQKTTAVYELIVVATGSLKPQQAPATQLSFSRQTKLLELNLPVEHLYSHPDITRLTFTNLAGGQAAVIDADGACLTTCRGEDPNQLIIRLSSPIEYSLQPGTYSISIGNLTFPQRLVVSD
ncbi:hypothetical protein [Spirosoma gilvum]